MKYTVVSQMTVLLQDKKAGSAFEVVYLSDYANVSIYNEGHFVLKGQPAPYVVDTQWINCRNYLLFCVLQKCHDVSNYGGPRCTR